ncbi:transporter [Prolixibacter sp. NT017]|uniref:transporter n=1 Tax=Prolixibacter sp. NT017 TaxID=2652390 RepID=UPI001298FE0A|nr:transporter [Prolixibacter sp. NT017]
MMKGRVQRSVVGACILLFSGSYQAYAGPPFKTDDPVPVPLGHWEYYVSSVSTYESTSWSGTLPHFEVNYGLIPHMQVHLLVPLNYSTDSHQQTQFGYADTELGMKYCFLKETKNRPQVGVFPIVEVPTVKNNTFSNGKVKTFLPVWAQKSWNKLTTYGGVGYQINPGTGNRNSTFAGWEMQYDFSKTVTLGGEIYFQSAGTDESQSTTGFDLGGFVNFSEKTHLLFSVGHSVAHASIFSSYLGLQWTI